MTDNCLFCGIVKDDIEASLVYEDELTLAFMNLRQGNPGHVLVIPKAHIETIDELDMELASALFRTVVKVAQGIKLALHPDGMNVWQSNGPAAGQEIPHIHFHLFPRELNDNRVRFYTQLPPLAERRYLNELAEQIRVALVDVH
jgi:histidine triad (HIT) family protein